MSDQMPDRTSLLHSHSPQRKERKGEAKRKQSAAWQHSNKLEFSVFRREPEPGEQNASGQN
jgi:hypothetical protein